MIDLCFILLGIAALVSFRPAAWVFVGITLLHDMLYGGSTGIVYFLTAGMSDLMIIMLIYYLPSPVTQKLMNISLISIVLNLYGWTMYESGQEPIIYSSAFIALYIYAIYVITGGRHAGFNPVRDWFGGLRRHSVESGRNH